MPGACKSTGKSLVTLRAYIPQGAQGRRAKGLQIRRPACTASAPLRHFPLLPLQPKRIGANPCPCEQRLAGTGRPASGDSTRDRCHKSVFGGGAQLGMRIAARGLQRFDPRRPVNIRNRSDRFPSNEVGGMSTECLEAVEGSRGTETLQELRGENEAGVSRMGGLAVHRLQRGRVECPHLACVELHQILHDHGWSAVQKPACVLAAVDANDVAPRDFDSRIQRQRRLRIEDLRIPVLGQAVSSNAEPRIGQDVEETADGVRVNALRDFRVCGYRDETSAAVMQDDFTGLPILDRRDLSFDDLREALVQVVGDLGGPDKTSEKRLGRVERLLPGSTRFLAGGRRRCPVAGSREGQPA